MTSPVKLLFIFATKKNPSYYISSLLLRVITHQPPVRYTFLVSQAISLPAKSRNKLLKNESFMNCQPKFYPKRR